MSVVAGYIVPTKPQPLLTPDASPGYRALRNALDEARARIAAAEADLILIYSTKWISVIGHQIQADPRPEWVHVDHEWHDLGDLPYCFRMDAEFGAAFEAAGKKRGLHTRTVAYKGFPIDTGTICALKLLNPDNRLPASVVSCNMYADRAETIVLGKAAADALAATGKRAIAIAVTQLSNRMVTDFIDPSEDHISSLKDDEWNRKVLEFLGQGRLEDVSQLARQFYREANADQRFKAIWWLAAVMGQHNDYDGEVLAYAPIWGTGSTVVSLTPARKGAKNVEFDEDDVELYRGDRNVLDAGSSDSGQRGVAERAAGSAASAPARATSDTRPAEPRRATAPIRVDTAPKPVGAYPHARRVGDMLFLSGVGPRQPGDDSIPGGPVRDAQGKAADYDVRAQTRACIENVRRILEASGSSMQKILDVTVFLVDMKRDFAAFNEIYAEVFKDIQATRTTIEVGALPTPIAVELKVLAQA